LSYKVYQIDHTGHAHEDEEHGTSMLKSVAAIAAGYIAMVVVVMIGTAAATAAFVPGGLAAAMSETPAPGPLPTAYLAANLLVSFAGAVLAGWIVSRLSPASPATHVLVLAGIMLIMTVVSAATGAAPGQPTWYPWVIGPIGLGGVLLGGMNRRGGDKKVEQEGRR
jgi:peptidoglycan/LPS O-acetylase OafA/YrhL